MRKMKESSVEWIGKIPKDWDLNKIAYIYEERNERTSEQAYMPLSVTQNGIVPKLEKVAKSEKNDCRKLVHRNEFVINSRSDRRGACGISEADGSVSMINLVLKPKKNINNLYFSYVFKPDMFADEFYRHGNGIVVTGISKDYNYRNHNQRISDGCFVQRQWDCMDRKNTGALADYKIEILYRIEE